MDRNSKMNVLVLGASGAGKSTLIKAVSGANIMTGVGEGVTDRIDVYESETWPMRFIDTKGFEYNHFKQRKTIKQVKNYTQEQLKEDNDDPDRMGIDAVWYCVEGTSRRTFSDNIELMNKAIKGWKGVPVFAVITKSYSEPDIEENKQALSNAFAKTKGVNLQGIYPVVAQEYPVTNEVMVPRMGIAALCTATLDCVDTAKRINEDNRKRMILEQKKQNANKYIAVATSAAAAVGAIPISIADAAVLVPLETAMTKSILKIYNVKISPELVSAVIGSTAISNLAKSALIPLKTLPIAGPVINGVVAGAIAFALGQSVNQLGKSIYTGKIDPNQINNVQEFIEEKLNNSKIVGTVSAYMQDNVDRLNEKSAKEIISLVLETAFDKSSDEENALLEDH